MDWTMGSFIEEACERVRNQVGDEQVILGLSGGVDSSVTAALLHKAIGDQLTCIFVNNGLLRAREEEVVQRVFAENFHIRLKYVDASERFLSKLSGVTDPEQKRKIIGNEFIDVFQHATEQLLQEDESRMGFQSATGRTRRGEPMNTKSIGQLRNKLASERQTPQPHHSGYRFLAQVTRY